MTTKANPRDRFTRREMLEGLGVSGLAVTATGKAAAMGPPSSSRPVRIGSGGGRLTLNGLEIGIDESSGTLVSLASPYTGVILRAEPGSAGPLGVAYPIDAYAPLRLAARYSRAHIEKEADAVTITWDSLGPSRAGFSLPHGRVFARVRFRAADDGRSVILTCRIENRSAAPIPQVVFPDLEGLQPFAGPKQTQLRFPRGVVRPFMAPVKDPNSAPFYGRCGWVHYPAKGYYGHNALRWLDYGSLTGGLSIFQKQWRTGYKPGVWTLRQEADPMSLRLLWEYKRMTIEPGQTWESGEFWLTPHPGGWAKGIEVFRNYVSAVNPPRRLPKHVRDDVGFRSIWMIQPLEPDPARAAFRFADLPRVAEEARDHGLREISAWGAVNYFVLPIKLRAELGTEEEFFRAIRQAREAGVNVAPFFSVHIILKRYLKRYGVKKAAENYTYDPGLIPYFRPYYTHSEEGGWVSSGNRVWQRDVSNELQKWIRRGLYSFGWDQFTNRAGPPPGGHEEAGSIRVMEEIRKLARAKAPESTFYGESISPYSLEEDGAVLDYTWNWTDYADAGPILNVLRAPRLNCNVEDSPLVVKKGFCDGLYLNVMPKKPDQPNGTALIREKPALSAALKEVARLRRRFLPYFVDGTFIGDSVLSAPASAFVRGHLLGGRLLVFVLNDQPLAQRVVIKSDLSLWLPSSKPHQVSYYDGNGELAASTRAGGAKWFGVTRLLKPLEIAVIEIKTQ